MKIQSIVDDCAVVHYEGDGVYNLSDEILDREITYIYPYDTGSEAAICIELEGEE